MASVVTFSRRRREPSSSQEAVEDGQAESAVTSATSYATAPSVLTPLAEAPAPGDLNVASTADSGPPAAKGQRRRLGAPAGRGRAAAHTQQLADLRAYFDEVDAFELTVETPTPKKGSRPNSAAAGKAAGGAQENLNPAAAEPAALPEPQPAASTTKMRPMSLGLSRRSSIVALPRGLASARKSGRPSHLRPSAFGLEAASQGGARDSLAPEPGAPAASALDHERRVSVVADSTAPAAFTAQPEQQQQQQFRRGVHRRSSAAGRASIGRASMTGQMLSRLSLGLSDALQWLGIRGSLPAVHQGTEPPAERRASAAPRPSLAPGWGRDVGDMSPITEELEPPSSSPAPPTPQCPAIAEEPAEPQSAAAVQQQPAESGVEPLTAGEADRTEAAGDGMAADAPEATQAAAASPAVAGVGGEQAQDAPEGPALAAEEAGDAVTELQQQLQAKLNLSEQREPASTLETLPSPTDSAAATAEEEEEELPPLQQLLVMCGQELDTEALPSMDALLGQHVDLARVQKIGEGTFGEAFKAGGVVFKIVPMEGEVLVNGEVQKRADEILAEAAITLTLSGLRGPPADAAGEQAPPPDNITSGFVETFGVGVCRGRYAAALRKEWHRWDKAFGSENDPVDIFGDDQLFVVFVVADGGLDLEHFEIRSFKELRSILLQACLTLAVAEEGCEFEHRDLHWGNLLIQRDGSEQMECRLRGCDIRAQTAGVTVTLIDFTLSRLLTAGGEAVFCNLAADPEIFKGPKGDVQAETYRRMKKATRNKWDGFTPVTNCLWMHYLADICLGQKLGFACSSSDKHELRNFRKRALGYASAGELLWDEFFAGAFLAQ